MSGGVRAAMQRAAGIVVLDLKMVAAGLVKIDRVGKVSLLRLGDLADAVFVLVGLNVLPSGFDFLVAGDAKAVMVVESFLRRTRAAFVDDQAPVGVGMFNRRFAVVALDNFHRQ